MRYVRYFPGLKLDLRQGDHILRSAVKPDYASDGGPEWITVYDLKKG
jgi:hypothetical protein